MDDLMIEALTLVLLTLLAVTGLAIARLRNLFAAAMLTGLFSLLSASVFMALDAVDVAFTEASVGAGITTVLMLGALALTRGREKTVTKMRTAQALLVTGVTGAALVYATLDMPHFGQPDTPVHTHPVRAHYLEASEKEIHIPNAVTSVLASYRGYDTLGEVTVIFTAGIGVFVLLGTARRRRR
ncbi:DUF4040 domain-containing protein [Salinisphaera sp. P385]|uniref:DUF4040 domain-containing protein n=1 Tax=Spectribacter acetivorans TaxID=3075603 RepID=A0ABU3B916_9GAMM|nr:DUF4040 domain-containing protein [Salinisphaera sp. P385]MDT0618734.1 DUF4040 domain-containing protein [Salinisphaera sp. P385]